MITNGDRFEPPPVEALALALAEDQAGDLGVKVRLPSPDDANKAAQPEDDKGRQQRRRTCSPPKRAETKHGTGMMEGPWSCE